MLDCFEEGRGLRGPVNERLERDIESMGDRGDEDFHPTSVPEKFSAICRTRAASRGTLPSRLGVLRGLQCFCCILSVGLGVLRGNFSTV